ncbi:MAG TPA: hypothetical protein VF986_05005 [Actinomycetota bacterium]
MRWVAFLGTVVLLAACQKETAPAQTRPPPLGQPAREVAEDLFVCPGGYGWPAYGDLVYAPNDSTKPAADVRPDRCFSSLDEAGRAGFHLPPPSSGGVLVDSIYLIPPNPALTPTCQDAARRLGFTLLCPGLVPGASDSIVACGRRDCVFLGALVLSFSFSGPPGYVGIPWENAANHLFVLEARAGRERTVAFLGCEGPRDAEPATVRGHPGQWIHCLDGETMNSGHVMLVWNERGVRYVVSLHSDTFTNRVIAAAVADGLEPITPGR